MTRTQASLWFLDYLQLRVWDTMTDQGITTLLDKSERALLLLDMVDVVSARLENS
jgi:hypothetical protein